MIGYGTFLYILNQDESPGAKLPWICVVLIIPPFGALFYGTYDFGIHTCGKGKSTPAPVAETIKKCGAVICTVDVRKKLVKWKVKQYKIAVIRWKRKAFGNS